MAFLSGIGGALGGVGLGAAVVEVAVDTSALVAGLEKAKAEVAATTAQASASAKVLSTGFIIAGAAAAIGLGKAISATEKLGMATISLQRITGQSAESASGLLAVADTFGVSTTTLTSAFGALEKKISLNSAVLGKYGLDVKNADGSQKDFNIILGDAADKYLALGDVQKGAALAQELFGRAGKELIPILQQGSAGIQQLEEEAAKYGIVLSQGTVDQVLALSKAHADLNSSIQGLQVSIGTQLVPVLTTFVHGLTDLVTGFAAIPGPIKSGVLVFAALTGGMLLLQKAVALTSAAWAPLITRLGAGAAAEVAAGAGATQLALELDAVTVSAAAAETAATGFLAKLALIARGGATGVGLAAPFNVVLPPEAPTPAQVDATDFSQVSSGELKLISDQFNLNAEAAQLAHDKGIIYSDALAQVEAAAGPAAGATADLTQTQEDLAAAADRVAAALAREKDANQALIPDIQSATGAIKQEAADRRELARMIDAGNTKGARYNALLLQTAADTQTARQAIRQYTRDQQDSGKTNEEVAKKLVKLVGGQDGVSAAIQRTIDKLTAAKTEANQYGNALDNLNGKQANVSIITHLIQAGKL